MKWEKIIRQKLFIFKYSLMKKNIERDRERERKKYIYKRENSRSINI